MYRIYSQLPITLNARLLLFIIYVYKIISYYFRSRIKAIIAVNGSYIILNKKSSHKQPIDIPSQFLVGLVCID